MSRTATPTLALMTLLAAAALSPAHAALQSYSLDLESNWGDLAPNTFVHLVDLATPPGGLHWGDGWFGQTTSPLQGSNNELRLGAGSFQVDHGGLDFYLDSVDFRSMQNGGHIQFDMVVRMTTGANVVFNMKIDGAPNVPLPPLAFTTFTGTAALGPLSSFTFGNFKTNGETTDRNLFVMDNLQFRMEPSAPVPEPSATALLALGMLVLTVRRRCRSTQG
jgi:hypothetical protein